MHWCPLRLRVSSKNSSDETFRIITWKQWNLDIRRKPWNTRGALRSWWGSTGSVLVADAGSGQTAGVLWESLTSSWLCRSCVDGKIKSWSKKEMENVFEPTWKDYNLEKSFRKCWALCYPLEVRAQLLVFLKEKVMHQMMYWQLTRSRPYKWVSSKSLWPLTKWRKNLIS